MNVRASNATKPMASALIIATWAREEDVNGLEARRDRGSSGENPIKLQASNTVKNNSKNDTEKSNAG